MTSIKFDNTETGWIEIPGTTEKIVAHFKDGHTETMELIDFATMKKRKKDLVCQIDCYTAIEQVPKLCL